MDTDRIIPKDPTKINCDTQTPMLGSIINQIKTKKIVLREAEGKRRGIGAWDNKKQSRFIESILIRLLLPTFYFDTTDNQSWVVLDGRERLLALKRFCITQELELIDLEYLGHLTGCNWDKLPTDFKRLIEETQINVFRILAGTPTDIKLSIIERVKAREVSYNKQDIRNIVFYGKPSKFIERLAYLKEFKQATQAPTYRRDFDFELINRFIAHYVLNWKESFYDIDNFLSRGMAKLKRLNEDEFEHIEKQFKQAMNIAYEIFGNKAFRIYLSDKNYDKQLPAINKSLFETLSVELARLTETEIIKLRNNKDILKEKFEHEFDIKWEFVESFKKGDTSIRYIGERNYRLKEIINRVIE